MLVEVAGSGDRLPAERRSFLRAQAHLVGQGAINYVDWFLDGRNLISPKGSEGSLEYVVRSIELKNRAFVQLRSELAEHLGQWVEDGAGGKPAPFKYDFGD